MSETKICSKCKKIKPITEFYKDRTKKDGLHSWCGSCKKKHSKEYWKKHKKKRKEYDKKYRQEIKEWLDSIKLESGCKICDYDKCAEALVFHHPNPKEKEYGIGRLIGHGKKRILEEMKKCIIVCKNCHAELHWRIRNNVS